MKEISFKDTLLEDIEHVIDLDKIAGDGKERRYLVYLPRFKDPSNPDNPLFFGTDYIDLQSVTKCQALVENIILRVNETMPISEAKELAEKEYFALVIEDLHTGQIYDYQYYIIQ